MIFDRRMGRVFVALVIFMIVGGSDLPPIESPTKRPMAVADSISMKYLVSLDRLAFDDVVKNFNFSPKGDHFFTVTRKADIEKDVNVYELDVYSTEDVISVVNSDLETEFPSTKTIVRLETSSNQGLERQHAIREAIWLNDEEIVFIGATGEEPSQVYSVDINTGNQRQITRHGRDVLSFDIDEENNTILYLSTLPHYHKDKSDIYYVAGIRSAFDLSNIDKEYQWEFRYRLFRKPFLNEHDAAQSVGRVFLGGMHYDRRFWLSPDGSKAIVVLPYEGVIDEIYKHYEPISNNYNQKRSIMGFNENVSRPSRNILFQFVLIDMNTGQLEEIFENAPTGFGSGSYRHKALWLPDGNKVVLATTFLPKADSGVVEWERRRRSPAIVSYDVSTKQVARVIDLTIPEGRVRTVEPFYDMAIDRNGLLIVQFRKLRDGPSTFAAFSFEEGEWVSAEMREMGPRRLALSHWQSLNTPPEILATDRQTGKSRIITDLNPAFRYLTLGTAEVFHWTDAEDRDWRGALVYPPDFETGRRYPLVIQTRGFRSDDAFFMDGPAPIGPFAARALANRGILVLQLPDHPEGRGQRRELYVHQKGIEGAIDALDYQSLIDRKRVGLIGVSRSGFYVDHVITFSEYDFAAAIMTDASSLNFGYYPLLFGLNAPGMIHIEDMLGGAVPWGASLDTFISRTTTFNLDRVKTPLRLERYLNNKSYAGAYWDKYTLMRRLGKPVELILYPKANHATINPAARMASAGGSVDWFVFWLKGEEDSSPAKAEQYRRWRKLRVEQEARSTPAAM